MSFAGFSQILVSETIENSSSSKPHCLLLCMNEAVIWIIRDRHPFLIEMVVDVFFLIEMVV